MRIQEVADELRTEFQEGIQSVRSDLTQKLDQLTESVLSLDVRLREFMNRNPSSTPTSSKLHSSVSDANGSQFRVPETPEQRILKSVKVEIPQFHGSDPNNWIFKAEMFFQMQQVPLHMKVQLAGLKMEGQASPWFQWMFNTGSIHQWDDFIRALRQRFGASTFVDLKGTRSKLSQSGSLMEYIRDFEALLNQVPGFSDDVLMSFFISGLQPNLRSAIQLQWPTSLHHAMQLAYAIDTHHDQLRSSLSSYPKKLVLTSSTPTTIPKPSPNPPYTHTPSPNIPKPFTPLASNLPIKKLSPEEIARKRELGICYTCDEKWTSKHRCKSKMLLLIGEIDEDQQDTEEEILWSPESKDDSLAATLHSLAGSFNPRALIFETWLCGHKESVLVDYGSSHNFINRELAHQLNVPMLHSKGMEVFMGNGDFLFCDKKCCKVTLLIQNHSFVVDLWVLELHDLSIILGMSWLESLGQVTHDYVEQSMEFVKDGQRIKLQGNMDSDDFSRIKRHKLSSCCVLSSSGSDVNEQLILPELEALKDTLSAELWEVLYKYMAIFQTPQSLPPFRGMDHSFHLMEGARPVNVKPYRFPHHQKSELEKQVTDLLSAGFIQPSKSAFSSPVLLVKKSDGSWRMCIDYRALNAITHNFFVKMSKCAFGVAEISYLGHIVCAEGVKADPQKVAAMVD
ncbi:uncharacterized protein LOC133296412 [Gastrolobium bilobum]|uniref:uncharacterized protein LOC133296412 n=1 Tax=Gastrolobium bilobum TaxID=150636 RepID=UPI002AB30B01|nr:uncharacterized protein LOC133296412 [Gastrolobium bilobum]